MYINKIDDLIDKTIDEFFLKIISEDKIFLKIIDEPNFVKYQLEINKILDNFSNKINQQELKEIVYDEDSIFTVIEIIKRYLAYYIFLYIGFFYKGKFDTYINNIIEFSKNQGTYNFKIENFFNSENNSNLIKFYELITNILVILDSDKSKKLVDNEKYKSAFEFLNGLGEEFVNNVFKLDKLDNNKKIQANNIIKTLIITEIYLKQEKKDIYMILENAVQNKNEFTFIDIIIPKEDFIDYNLIESSLSIEDVEKGLVSEIYELLLENKDIEKRREKSLNDKILELINNKILIPISEDFLLYHKDTEKYDKSTSKEEQQKQKQKEQTKIKYIVTKIEKVSEYYSKVVKKNKELKKETEKLFYQPLHDRLGVLINNTEEIRIINKLINVGAKNLETNEYLHDLEIYRQYPYVNFKEFNKYGFNLNLNKTIDIVRYTTFNDIDNNKYNKHLQLRVGSDNTSVNIVGFIINNRRHNLHCLIGNDLNDIRDVSFKTKQSVNYIKNGYDGTLKLINHIYFKENNKVPIIYWLFDINKDTIKLETYDQTSKLTEQDNIKLIVSKLYDDIMDMTYNKIINKLEKTKKKLTIDKFKKLIEQYENKIFKIPKESNFYINLENIYYTNKYFKTEKKYDTKEDIFYGLSGEIIELPSVPKNKKKPITTIKISQFEDLDRTKDLDDNEEIIGAICQHNITWDNITQIRKTNPNDFINLLHEFIRKYVIESKENEYVCKSCGTLLDIKNFIPGGSYNEDGQFVSFYTPIDVPLETMPQYEKYKTTIINIDKLVERVANITNAQFLIGKSYIVRIAIKRIVKDIIDLLLIHNDLMRESYRDRNEKIINKYGINKDLTNFFIFPLDNSIFTYSSKEKDYYKPIKRNNILLYVVFLILIEYSETQILFASGDKTCNYYLYSKYGRNLFDNIKILKNINGETVSILEYESLCYMIFYYSCLITKYNLWSSETEDKLKDKKFNPIIQKKIIHSLIDLINSIIEVYSKVGNKHSVYEIVSIKFFQRLTSVYKKTDILDKIKAREEGKIITTGSKVKYVTEKIKSTEIKEFVGKNFVYTNVEYWSKKIIDRLILPVNKYISRRYYNINNITNCESGEFHDWKNKDNTMICNKCDKILSKIELNDDLTYKIIENYKYLTIKNIAKKFCNSGTVHTYVFDNKLKCDVCSKCKFKNIQELTKADLDTINKLTIDIKNKQDTKLIKLNEINLNKKEKKEKKLKEFINNIKNRYSKTKEHKEGFYNFIDQFIDKMELIIGKNINLSGNNIYLAYDAYIIDHDHNGFKIDNPIIITEKENKIIYKRNHDFFKTDVIYFNNNRLQIDIYYDAISHLLLGYKEKTKNYEYAKRIAYIKINYSIKNKLKMLGYKYKYTELYKIIENIDKEELKDTQQVLRNIISDISRLRINNLKKTIIDIQRYIYRAKYNYKVEIDEELIEEQTDIFINKYLGKLNNIIVRNKEDKIFKNWKIVKNGIFLQELNDKIINMDIQNKYILFDDISYYDYHGNLILYYIIEQLDKLIEYNTNKIIQTNITYFIIDIINNIFELYNEEILIRSYDIKRFSYIMNSETYIYDTIDEGYGLDNVEGFYGEYKDPNEPEDIDKLEEKENAIEEEQAMDMEEEQDYEIDYEVGVNYN